MGSNGTSAHPWPAACSCRIMEGIACLTSHTGGSFLCSYTVVLKQCSSTEKTTISFDSMCFFYSAAHRRHLILFLPLATRTTAVQTLLWLGWSIFIYCLVSSSRNLFVWKKRFIHSSSLAAYPLLRPSFFTSRICALKSPLEVHRVQ